MHVAAVKQSRDIHNFMNSEQKTLGCGQHLDLASDWFYQSLIFL